MVRISREFGFCYGVDRAVDYAIRRAAVSIARSSTGEIIHNPHVNNELRVQGIRFSATPPNRSIA